ncbi:MAG: response regulator [Myxococcales bacterium]|nr:response regulator [Myxococcales bacterium]
MPSRRIILVEDDPDLLRALTRILRRAGHDVFGCATSRDALHELEQAERFDLMISDLNLAEGTCDDLLGEARRRSPSTRLMVLTAALDPPGLGEDVSVYAKPIGAAELVRVVHQQLA